MQTLAGREKHVTAIRLLLDMKEFSRALHQKRWSELAAAVEYAQHDAPESLAQTDPALYRALRAAITEYHLRGYSALDLVKIQALAQKAK